VQALLWTARRGCFEQQHIQIRHLCVIIAKEWIRQQLEIRVGVSAGTSRARGLAVAALPVVTSRCDARVFHFLPFVFCVHYIILRYYPHYLGGLQKPLFSNPPHPLVVPLQIGSRLNTQLQHKHDTCASKLTSHVPIMEPGYKFRPVVKVGCTTCRRSRSSTTGKSTTKIPSTL
jgi:hypothetical protein